MTMGDDSPKDKLLEASGLHKKEMPLQGLRELQERTNAYLEATVREAEKVVAAAQSSKRSSEEMFQQLRKYCSETVPVQMVAALDEMARKRIFAAA